MAWQDELLALRGEVETALTRILGEPVEEDDDVIRDRTELYQLAGTLQIAQMLLDMNEIVLSGTGRVESTSLMEYYDEDDAFFEMEDLRDGEGQDDDEENEDEPEEGEELRLTLFWEDSTECAVDVELGKSEGRIYLLVNGEEVRPQREVLETAVLDAFRKEMNLLAS